MQPMFFIIYDSIHNSVFISQVVMPLITKLNATPELSITIISFERLPQNQYIPSPWHPRLHLKILPRSRFWGMTSLIIASWRLKRFLGKFDSYTLMARGPLAGWIAIHGQSILENSKRDVKTKNNPPIIIQARGLCAAEYLFTHKSTSPIASIWQSFRAQQYARIEKSVYGYPIKHSSIIIEAVSPALKTYLHKTWHTPLAAITIATNDIPTSITPENKKKWRTEMRHQLSISHNALVYVYAGSAHTWQCPAESIHYVYEQWQKNHHVFLLILSQDQKIFTQLCATIGLPPSAYHVTQVPHTQIYHYLAAADYGLLFRQPDLINWVSRPTKLLEYRAAGLTIIHNNSIDYAIAEQIVPNKLFVK